MVTNNHDVKHKHFHIFILLFTDKSLTVDFKNYLLSTILFLVCVCVRVRIDTHCAILLLTLMGRLLRICDMSFYKKEKKKKNNNSPDSNLVLLNSKNRP